MSQPGGHLGRFVRLGLLLCIGPATAISCAPQAAGGPAPVDVPRGFSRAGSVRLPDKWWRGLNDPRLNELVDRALAGNLSLRGAWDRLAQARASAVRSGASLYPSLEGTAGASWTASKTAGAGMNRAGEFSLGLAAGYEVDLWGRLQATHDAARLDMLATRESLHATAISLTAEVAEAWYRLVEQRGQLNLLDEQIETNRKALELVTLRFRRGRAPATDVLQQRQLVEATRGEKVQGQADLKILEHGLAILLGRPPGAAAVPDEGKLPELPPLPKTGLPLEWVQRRPDIRSAYLAVQAADRRVAAAIADRFPQLSLSIRAETGAEKVRNLFDNWLATIAASLVAPLLDGGLREAEVDRTRAAAAESLHAYGQVVLDSLKEVEDALWQEAEQRQLLASLVRQLELSQQSLDRTRDSYTKGAMDFLRLLTSLLSHQNLQRNHLRARRELVRFRINLYRALGGGWQLRQPQDKARAGHRASRPPMRKE